MQINVRKVHPDATIPAYTHPGDAGFDVCAVEEMMIAPGERKMIPIGLAFEIPEGHVLLVWDKSGLAKNHGLTNLAGVIDAGFRGESSVLVFNSSDVPYEVKKGQKIAQMLLQKVERAELVEADALSETSRGEGGWGSTGV